ncbi:MAG: hypothetical protein ACTSQ0_00130 [Candidatus Heimdallarchaeota archaeon]
MKKNKLLTIMILLFLCVQPIFKMYPDLNLYNNKVDLREKELVIAQSEKPPSITSVEKSDNSLMNSSIERSFLLNDTISNEINSLSIDSCEDWNVNGEFYFDNLRSEKIVNGDAESTETIWTDYIPSHYDGNVTQESSPKQGEVISGNSSWYFDIKSQDHTTIVGFDDAINLEGNSVIFSLSYSLLSNSLGTSFDSNICIRLLFQFDIYIFIWFNGNPSVLSNVTGPGGYADLLVNNATFNGEVNNYSLNITKLGLELFYQEPDQLRSFAVQTWGEESYQMEFMIDNLSLTDEITPNSINLAVNSNLVTGSIGTGYVLVYPLQQSTVMFEIEFISTNKIYWGCRYNIFGWSIFDSRIKNSFINYDTIRITENCNESIISPTNVSLISYQKWVSKDWLVDNIIVDSITYQYSISESNITHNKISFQAPNFGNSLEISYFTINRINNISLSNNQITHDELLQINIESEILNEVLEIQIMNSDEEVIYSNITTTNLSGSTFILYRNPSSEIARDNYTIQVFWQRGESIGIGISWFQIISKPTKIISLITNTKIEYQQPIELHIDYLNVENNITIDFATVTYSWEYGSDSMDQNLEGFYFVIFDQIISPGFYNFTIVSSKTDFATATYLICIEVIFSTFDLILNTPFSAVPGETISINSIAMNNLSKPLQNLDIKFEVNNQFLLQTTTNETGSVTIYYQIPSNYVYPTLNISCIVLMNETELLISSKEIFVELYDISRTVTLGSPTHFDSYSKMNSTFFNFCITYPSIGEKWQTSIPNGFTPKSAIILTSTGNITANISPGGLITWERLISDQNYSSDILLLENPIPEPLLDITQNKTSISIEITIQINSIPYNGLDISITKSSDWSSINNWKLFSKDIDISQSHQLQVTETSIDFKVDSSNEISIVFMLVGSIESIVSITPSTIILGVGIVSLTIASTFLLFKKKSNVSLDIQL